MNIPSASSLNAHHTKASPLHWRVRQTVFVTLYPAQCELLHSKTHALNLLHALLKLQSGSQEEAAAKEAKRLYVVKDDSQPRCAFCSEPFEEAWDDELQVRRGPLDLPFCSPQRFC